MTDAARLLNELRALGVTLQPHGDALRFSPRSAVTPELLARLRTHKGELLAMLASGPQPGNGGNGDTTHATTGETAVVSPTVPQDLPNDGDGYEREERAAIMEYDGGPVTPAPSETTGDDRHGAGGPQHDHGDAGQHLQPSDSDAGERLEMTDADGRRCLVRSDVADLQVIDLPTPCPTCNGLDCWQDVAGGLHCVTCSPATPTGERLRRRAAELRRRYPVTRESDLQPRPVTVPRTWPPAVPDSILAAPIPTCRDCGRRAVIGGQPGRPAGFCYSCWVRQQGTVNAAGLASTRKTGPGLPQNRRGRPADLAAVRACGLRSCGPAALPGLRVSRTLARLGRRVAL